MKSLLFFVLLISICFEVIFTKGETTHPNRPKGREKHVTGTGKPVKRRGEGLGIGPVRQTDRPKNLKIIKKIIKK